MQPSWPCPLARSDHEAALASIIAGELNRASSDVSVLRLLLAWKSFHGRFTALIRSIEDDRECEAFLNACGVPELTYIRDNMQDFPIVTIGIDDSMLWQHDVPRDILEEADQILLIVEELKPSSAVSKEQLMLLNIALASLLDAYGDECRLRYVIKERIVKCDMPANDGLLERYLNLSARISDCTPYVAILQKGKGTRRVLQDNKNVSTLLSKVNKALVLQRDMLTTPKSWSSINYIVLLTGFRARFDAQEVSKAVVKTVKRHDELVNEAVKIYNEIMLNVDDNLTREVATTLLEFLTPRHPTTRQRA